MKVTRWPALAVFSLLIIGFLIIQPDDESSPVVKSLQRNQPSLVGDVDNLSSTWYCAAGTVGGSGIANHELLLGNSSNLDSSAVISVVSVLAPTKQEPEESSSNDELDIYQLPTIDKEFFIPARSMISIKLSEIDGVAGEYAAALIQSNLGSLIVEHRLSGPFGETQSSCASTTSPVWNFAAGTTRLGAREMIFLFNPYPDNAVVDISFAADGRTRRPEAYNGLVVPPSSLLPIDLTSVVTLSETISARITSRTGRIVAERLVVLGDELSPKGLSTEIGSPSLNNLWVFPGGFTSEGLTSLVMFNPSESEIAEIDIEIIPDILNYGYVEPLSVNIPASSSRSVSFKDGQDEQNPLLVDASKRIPKGIPFWVVVRSANNVQIAAERFALAQSEGNLSSSISRGVNLSGKEHYFLMLESTGEISVANPAQDRLTLLQLMAYSDGKIFESQIIEVSAKSRKVINLQQLGIPNNSVIKVVSTEPIALERFIGPESIGGWGSVSLNSDLVEDLLIMEPQFD